MAYFIDFGDVHFTLKSGFVLKDELNETLDSGLVSFLHTGDLSHESFDRVEVSQENDAVTRLTDKTLLVDSFETDIVSYGATYDSNLYNYNMTLFSETKELERIVLPNCSVTQPINGNQTLSVFDEIKRFVNLYGLKIKVGTQANFTYQPKYTISTAVSSKFASVKCPEFQWNRPTLREVLNDLMSTKDCIVILRNNKIDLIDLSAKGNQIDTTKLLYIKPSMTSQDYVGELSIDMQNAIGKNRTTVCEYISLRAPDGEATMTTENCVIRTQHPIYGIKKVIVYVCLRDRVSSVEEYQSDSWRPANVTDNVVEQEQWNLLSSIKVGGTAYSELEDITDSDGVSWKAHKVNFLYYKRGESEIKNFGTLYDAVLGVSTTCFVTYIQNKAGTPTTAGISYDQELRNIIVKVEYETVMEHSMNVGKYLPNNHPNNRIVDNQTNSYVDIQHQSIFEYAKANRLGNKIKEIGGNYSNDSSIPALGDRIGDMVLFSREICYWDSFVQFKGYVAPYYILKDFFTGVFAKKRAYQIASGNEALTRHDVYKAYIEASFTPKFDDWRENEDMPIQFINDAGIGTGFLYEFIYAIDSYTNFGGIQHAVCSTMDKNELFYPQKSASEIYAVVMDLDIEVQGMSICFNFGYNDNLKSADYIIRDDSEYKQMFYPYADENGEFESHTVELLGGIYGFGNMSEFLPNHNYAPSKSDEVRNASREKPKISWDGAEYQNRGLVLKLNVKKDNREIIQHSIQFEYCSDSKDIIITKRFIDLSRLLATSDHSISSLKMHWYTTPTKYYLGQEKDNGGSVVTMSLNDLSISELSQYVILVENTRIPSTATAWSITDSNNNILIAVNGSNQLFFNLLRDRDTNIYGSDKKTIVGKLGN